MARASALVVCFSICKVSGGWVGSVCVGSCALLRGFTVTVVLAAS